MWYLVGLVWIALVIGVFWSYKNKKVKRDAAREQQFRQMFSAAAVGGAVALAPTVNAPAAAAASVRFARKPRLLSTQTALLYYVLRSGLPDHEIFINVPVSNLIEAPAQNYEAGQKMRQLAAARADFVVCNKQMEIVAAVLVNGSTGAGLIEECLQNAGIRAVRIDLAAPPKHAQVRTLVYGEA